MKIKEWKAEDQLADNPRNRLSSTRCDKRSAGGSVECRGGGGCEVERLHVFYTVQCVEDTVFFLSSDTLQFGDFRID